MTDNANCKDGVILDPQSCVNRDEFLRSGAVLWHHGKDPAVGMYPIGVSLDIEIRPTFIRAATQIADHEFALKCWEGMTAKPPILKTWSVGWWPVSVEPKRRGGRVVVNGWEMKEYSLEPVPSDPDCITESLRSAIDTIRGNSYKATQHGVLCGTLTP